MNTDKTDDLMNRLNSVEDNAELNEYVNDIDDRYPAGFADYIKQILEQKGMSVADLQKKSRIDRTYIYQIMDGSKNPGRDKIIAMALGAQLTLEECQRALKTASEGILYAKNRRDSILIYAVNNRLSIMETNALLEEYQTLPLQ